ncbi:MAG: M61 family metallopeptidase [Novosphingobium sp.]
MGRTTGRFAALLLALIPPAIHAEEAGPPAAAALPAAQDSAWPGGTITLDIDASDIRRGVFRVVETIPVAPGTRRVTLLYPQWLPGRHAPRGQLAELADLRFEADGRPATWRRDAYEVHAFHVDMPPGAREVKARFVFTSPLQPGEGRVVMTQEMLNLQWEAMSLYPAGHYVRRIRVKPSATFPLGWTAAAALDGKQINGDRVTWAETDYETLVDSPVFAGQYYRRWELGEKMALNLFADSPEQLDARPEQIAVHARLAREASILFGPANHFDRYEFLLALSDRIGSIGLEHLRSSENQLEPDAFVQWAKNEWDRGLLPHELAHSWNGKLRRPAGLRTPDYRTPMQGDLLWVYEGQTQFWGMVLAARSGLQSPGMVLAQLASNAGNYAELPGRDWRALEDTTFDPIVAARKPRPYPTLTRNEDYYSEGALVWLEADQIIRTGTGGKRGLDDFARQFFGGREGSQGISTYERADVMAALNALHAYDWDEFFRQRIERPGQPAPLAGLEIAGYRLVWKDKPNPYDSARMDQIRGLNLNHSLGISIDREGLVSGARWNGPAFNAGIVTGARLIAVNGTAYDPERLKAAITAAKGTGKPIDLLIRRGDRYLTVGVPYYGGLRWPWLERIRPGGMAPLDRLLAPRLSR